MVRRQVLVSPPSPENSWTTPSRTPSGQPWPPPRRADDVRYRLPDRRQSRGSWPAMTACSRAASYCTGDRPGVSSEDENRSVCSATSAIGRFSSTAPVTAPARGSTRPCRCRSERRREAPTAAAKPPPESPGCARGPGTPCRTEGGALRRRSIANSSRLVLPTITRPARVPLHDRGVVRWSRALENLRTRFVGTPRVVIDLDRDGHTGERPERSVLARASSRRGQQRGQSPRRRTGRRARPSTARSVEVAWVTSTAEPRPRRRAAERRRGQPGQVGRGHGDRPVRRADLCLLVENPGHVEAPFRRVGRAASASSGGSPRTTRSSR